MAKDKMKNMSTRKKASRLFWGSLAPLLTVTIVACTFFYNVSDKILKYYMDAELTKSVERVNANMLEKMSPVMINVENFTNIVSITDDKEVIQFLVEKFAENLGTASSIYYTTVENWERGNGYFIESSGWMPSSGFDPATREWYKNAVANKGEVQFSSPYVDVQTNKIAVTISQAVTDTNGKIKGVVGCDMILDDLVALLREIKISKTATMEVITDNGLYMTSEDQSKIMNVNYFTVSDFPGSKAEWLDGTTRTLVNSKKYYAITKVGPAPWFIVAEGSVQDFKGTLANIIIIFEIALVIFSIFCSVMNIRTIQKMRKGEQELGAKLFEETQTLVVAAKENAATSQDQSAAVKEIVATMEDSNALSESISSKIKDVSKVAENTSTDVATGVASIEQNVAQLHDIFNANQQTIEGMKVLSDKIESIWDIVTLINNIADLYLLTPEQLNYEGNRERSAQKIVSAIEASKQVPFERVVFALGIRMVGEQTAKILARHFKTIEALRTATVEQLTEVDGIGGIIAVNIVEYFHDTRNIEIVDRLISYGLQMSLTEEQQSQMGTALEGKSIVISGVFTHHSRDEYKDIIERNGGKNVGSISKKTSFVLAGENMGPSKLEKAQKLGVQIMSEEEFLQLIMHNS